MKKKLLVFSIVAFPCGLYAQSSVDMTHESNSKTTTVIAKTQETSSSVRDLKEASYLSNTTKQVSTNDGSSSVIEQPVIPNDGKRRKGNVDEYIVPKQQK